MPLYDYICPKTGEEREVRHGMNEKPEILSKAGHKMVKKIGNVNLGGFDKYGRSTK